MFHSISKGRAEDANQISAADFKKLLNDLHDLGFTAIDMQQLSDFLSNNAKIPRRSVLLIVDDRHFAEYFNDHFRPYHDQWGWPVVNAYIAKDERPDLWAENAALSAEGWVDYQAHGVIHNINMNDNSTDEYLTSELQGAINNLQKYVNKIPIAIIWPGGDFGIRPVQLSRENSATIWGLQSTREERMEGYYMKERRLGSMIRVIRLPASVTEKGGSATFKNGVLEVRLKKSPEERKKQIPID